MDCGTPNAPQRLHGSVDLAATTDDDSLVSAFLACSAEPVVLIDTRRRRLLACNAAATQHFGLSRFPRAASDLSAWLLEPSLDTIVQQVSNVADSAPVEIHTRCSSSDGARMHQRFRAMIVKVEGRPALLLASTSAGPKAHALGKERPPEDRARETRFQSLVESLETGYIFYRQRPDRSFDYLSPAIEQVLGYSVAELTAAPYAVLTDNPVNQEAAAATRAALAGFRQPPFEIEMRHRCGALRRLRISQYPLLDDADQVTALQGIAEDVTDAWRNRTLLDARNQLLEQIAGGKPLEQVLATLILSIEALEPKMRCSVLRFDPTQRRLYGLAVASLPDRYSTAIEGMQVHAQLGSCGAAVCTGERVVTPSILDHPYWADFRDLLAQTPLRACWSEPIKGRGGQVLGTFAMYFEEVREPRASELEVIASAADLAALAIQQKHDAEALAIAEERARLLLECSTEGIFGLDLDGRITFINPAASAMLGHPADGLLGQRPYALLRHSSADGVPFDGRDCPLHRAATEGIEHQGIKTLLYRRDGNPIPIEYKAAPIRHGGHADGAVVSFHDISDRLDHERRIEFLAFHDALTGVANRRMFTERLKEALARYRRGGECFALHLLDLDHFKEINDRLGHPTGDRLLFAIAQRVDGLLREVDLLARLGGDEFAVIQRGVRRPAEAVRLAERMLDALQEDFLLGDVTVHSGSSIGITLPQADTLDATELMKQADIALYRAKDAGRGIAALFEPG